MSMPQALVRLVVAAALFASAPELLAQTVPLPSLPEAPPPAAPVPGTEPSPAPTPGTPRAQPAAPAEDVGPPRPKPLPWEYRLGVGIFGDTNIDFLFPDGAGGTAVVPGGQLTRNVSSARGELRADVAGRWIGYPDPDVLDRSYLDAGLRGEYRSSPRTTWSGDVHYWLGYTDSSPTLIEQGVVLPLGETGTLTGEAVLNRQLGGRAFVRVEGRVLRVDFEDPAFIDSRSLRGTVALGRHLGARDTASLAYALEGVLSDETGTSYLTHYGSLQWTRTLSPRSALLLEGGASYTPKASEVGLGRSEGFFGGVTFLREFGRSSLTAYLRREVAPAFGLGVSRQETRLGLRGDVPMGRDWTLSVAAYHIQPQTPEGAEGVFAPSSDATAALDRRLGRLFTVSSEARYRRRGESAGNPAVSGFQAGLYVSLGTPRR